MWDSTNAINHHKPIMGMGFTMDLTTHVWWYMVIFLGMVEMAARASPTWEVIARLREHYYGGWVAPGIYYMGAAGVLRVGCLRIAGISGSFASGDLVKGLESIYNICWKLILYICVCACVMFNICVCDVHPCTINFALLSLDMVVWDADYDVILLSVGFSTSWSHVSGDYFRGRHECPPYTEELVSSSWVSWAGPGRKWLPGVSFGLCWPHLIFSCTRGLIKSTISRATAEYSKIFQDDSHVTSCNYADYAYITFIALMNQHQWNIGTAFRILP